MPKTGLAVALVVGLIGAGLVGAVPANAQTDADQVLHQAGSGSSAGVMMNEVEMNPKGRDSGREWIELYNPTSSDINIGNFAIKTHVRPFTITIPAGTVIDAGGFYVVKVEGERLGIVEKLTLVRTDGKRVDSTPSLLDKHNNDRTWQRVPDGSSTWKFAPATQDKPNDPSTYENASRSAALASSTDSAATNAECHGSALCFEGKVYKMVDTNTLYVESNGQKYKVDLSLTKVSRSDEDYKKGSKITRQLCLGSEVLVDQDDGQSATSKVRDALAIKGVIYCSSQNLNEKLLDSRFVGLDHRQCFVSEFSSQDWATRHGCK